MEVSVRMGISMVFSIVFLIGTSFTAGKEKVADQPKHEQVALESKPEMAPQVHTVAIKGMQYQPAELTVNKGDKVIWVNHDPVKHDVTEEPGKAWTSSPIEPGDSWHMVVTENVDYYCSLHVVMKGKIIVR